jgi:hypothetical protein
VRAFIVRPFGIQRDIDFDAVERLLIRPALQSLSIDGGTTGEIVSQGNIRDDMFRMLVSADIAIADLSIHNANVFYELGIRHGLRSRATLLMRANVDKYPFDLNTDRYFVYDVADPAAALPALIDALRSTLAALRTDSPVYEILRSLKPPDPSVLQVVPRAFNEEIARALSAALPGNLQLLATEAQGLEWESEGLRRVGRTQLKLKAFRAAKETFDRILEIRPDDVEANQRAATIYQRLAATDGTTSTEDRRDLLTRSTQAIERVLDSPVPSRWDRAEAFALKGRNAKVQWYDSVRNAPDSRLVELAVQSPLLTEAIQSYATGFSEDLNHYYSGLNAMSLLCVLLSLVSQQPDRWSEQFDNPSTAAAALAGYSDQYQQLGGAVRLSVQARRRSLERQPIRDQEDWLWMRMSEADLAFLTATNPKAAARCYREALTGALPFDTSSARYQLDIFERLGIRAEFVAEAVHVFDELAPLPPVVTKPDRVLLFTGHMIDEPNRAEPRFPRTAAAEAEARRLIRDAVINELTLAKGAGATVRLVGCAGGACGGDILFHEVCEELQIPTIMLLLVPPDLFVTQSVQRGGAEWVERFNRLRLRGPVRVLQETLDLPPWLQDKKGENIWKRDNRWMLFNALALDASRVTLIALWNQQDGDGSGGTADLVNEVLKRGHKVARLPAEQLKAL